MRAKEEYEKWCALESQWEESRYSRQQEVAYITGFNRAVDLMSKLIKESQNESSISIQKRQITSGQRGEETSETLFSD